MNLQRTPPHTTLTRGSGSGSGSVPNLSTYEDDSINNINTRKRKERCEQEEYKNDFDSFRAEIMLFFQSFAETQNKTISDIRSEISEIKDEIKAIKSVTENFALQLDQINDDIKNIKSDNTITQHKIKKIENELSQLKTRETTDHTTSKSLPLSHENLILELKERSEREKNIVIIGIPEKNDKNYIARRTHDIEEFSKLTLPVLKDCPKPTNAVRLGKYVPGIDRPLKIYYHNSEIAKLILQNKTKFPENVKIYSDQTPAQKRYLQSVKKELSERLENGEEHLIIKYIKGIPRIVKNKTFQKN